MNMDNNFSPSGDTFFRNNQMSDEIRFKTPDERKFSPHFSPSPDFQPFNYSSPAKSDRRMNNYNRRGNNNKNKRYFNMSDPGGSNNSNFNSPFHKHQRTGRGWFNRGGHINSRKSGDIPISAYVEPSMTQDPWLALERQYENNKLSQSSQDSPSQPSPPESTEKQ